MVDVIELEREGREGHGRREQRIRPGQYFRMDLAPPQKTLSCNHNMFPASEGEEAERRQRGGGEEAERRQSRGSERRHDLPREIGRAHV